MKAQRSSVSRLGLAGSAPTRPTVTILHRSRRAGGGSSHRRPLLGEPRHLSVSGMVRLRRDREPGSRIQPAQSAASSHPVPADDGGPTLMEQASSRMLLPHDADVEHLRLESARKPDEQEEVVLSRARSVDAAEIDHAVCGPAQVGQKAGSVCLRCGVVTG